jgi:hypothetical protein
MDRHLERRPKTVRVDKDRDLSVMRFNRFISSWSIGMPRLSVIPLSREARGPNHGQRCLLPRGLRDRLEKGCRRDLGTNRVEVAPEAVAFRVPVI